MRSILLTLLFCAFAAAAIANPVTGRVRLIGVGVGGVPPIVYAEPLDGGRAPAPARRTLLQRNKAFVPRLLAVPAGSTIDFPNEDPIFHNVFSLSGPAVFDLGLYRAGASKSRTFDQAGVYRVFCNIHPQMTAVIVVLSTALIAQADSSGSYSLDLAPGRYRLTAWSERSAPASIEITVGSAGAQVADLTLDGSNFVEVPHKNKFGQDYPSIAYDPLRDAKGSPSRTGVKPPR